MGQKANPIGYRLGIVRDWNSRWYGDYKLRVAEDYKIRSYIKEYLSKASISNIYIERTIGYISVNIYAQRPALIIGKGGKGIAVLKNKIKKINGKDECEINILEVKRPELDAALVAQNIANQIENRVSYKKAIKLAISSTMRMNAEGIKVQISGRLGGAEMARRETYKEGRIPLSTIRINIDYALHEAHTTYGCIGIKVWIMKGEVYDRREITSMVAKGSYKKTKRMRPSSKEKRENI